jgi:hypothetical protein
MVILQCLFNFAATQVVRSSRLQHLTPFFEVVDILVVQPQ